MRTEILVQSRETLRSGRSPKVYNAGQTYEGQEAVDLFYALKDRSVGIMFEEKGPTYKTYSLADDTGSSGGNNHNPINMESFNQTLSWLQSYSRAGLNDVMHEMTGPGDPPGKNSVQEKQPWDLNGDGILQKNEADNWWLMGKGADIWVDNSLINWSGLEMPLNTPVGKTFSIDTHNAFVDLPYETASTYGGTSFVRTGERTASVIDQKYHYDYRSNTSVKDVIRNFMNWYGKPSLPWPNNIPRLQGVDYMIHYQYPQIKFK